MTGGAEGVERHVRSAAGELGDGGRHVRRRPSHARARRPAPRARSSAPGATSTATTRAPAADGDLHGGQPDPAAAVHRHPLPRPHPADLHDGAEGGGVAAAQRGGGGQVQLLGDGDQVDVGRVEGDELGQRAPVGEPGLGLARRRPGGRRPRTARTGRRR